MIIETTAAIQQVKRHSEESVAQYATPVWGPDSSRLLFSVNDVARLVANLSIRDRNELDALVAYHEAHSV